MDKKIIDEFKKNLTDLTHLKEKQVKQVITILLASEKKIQRDEAQE
jgi:hypothetical protein